MQVHELNQWQRNSQRIPRLCCDWELREPPKHKAADRISPDLFKIHISEISELKREEERRPHMPGLDPEEQPTFRGTVSFVAAARVTSSSRDGIELNSSKAVV